MSARDLRIDQVLPSFAPRDAIGYHTVHMQKLIRSFGIESRIYADEIKDGMEGLALPTKALFKSKPNERRIIIYQASTDSPIVRRLLDRGEPIIINFHNITPKEILGRWDIGVGIIVGAGIKQLGLLKERLLGAISVSNYNKWCLKQEGIVNNSLVASPFIPDITLPETKNSYKNTDGHSRWLFVGRITPNKAQHDIVNAFNAYVTGWDEKATLTLVGSTSSQKYHEMLKSQIAAFGLNDKIRITGPISSETLAQEYKKATVFICLSDHEGFGFPIIEAMRHDLPVIAYSQTAITETVGNAGILLARKDPIFTASAVSLIETNTKLRNEILSNSKVRLEKYNYETAKLENTAALESLIPGLREYR